MITCLIDLFTWEKSNHSLHAHYSDLGYNHLLEIPGEIVVVGRKHTVNFLKNGYADHYLRYEPTNIVLPYQRLPTSTKYENIILVIRDWK